MGHLPYYFAKSNLVLIYRTMATGEARHSCLTVERQTIIFLSILATISVYCVILLTNRSVTAYAFPICNTDLWILCQADFHLIYLGRSISKLDRWRH